MKRRAAKVIESSLISDVSREAVTLPWLSDDRCAGGDTSTHHDYKQPSVIAASDHAGGSRGRTLDKSAKASNGGAPLRPSDGCTILVKPLPCDLAGSHGVKAAGLVAEIEFS